MRAHSVPPQVPWSLVFFTVGTQAAVGLVAIAAVLSFVPDARGEVLLGPSHAVPVTALVFLALASLAAALHLARPRAVRYVAANLRTSWLSREVVLAGIFGLLLLLWWVLPGEIPGAVLGLLAALAGLALLHAVTHVYRMRTIPAWDHPTTPFTFLGTSVLLGAVLVGILLPRLAWVPGPDPAWLVGALRVLGLAVLLAAAWQTGMENWRHHRFPPQEGAGGVSGREHRWILAVRVVSLLLGAVLFFVVAWWGAASGRSRVPSFQLALVILLASECMGRFAFYASHRRAGL